MERILGMDGIYGAYLKGIIMIEKKGDRWCVVHGSPQIPGSKTDKPKGAIIKCYSIARYGEKGAHDRALAMHRAIEASKTSGR